MERKLLIVKIDEFLFLFQLKFNSLKWKLSWTRICRLFEVLHLRRSFFIIIKVKSLLRV